MSKVAKSGSADGANVTTLDFGEKFDELIQGEAVRLAGRGPGKSVKSNRQGYRPGMYGGKRPSMGAYRPWYASRGQGSGGTLGNMLKLPAGIASQSKELFTGGLIGVVGNRTLAWVAPGVLKTSNKIAVEGVAFGVTLIPYLVKQNVTTFGIALPGLFAFLGALTEYAISSTGLLGAQPNLSGSQRSQRGHNDAVLAARRKLAEAQARMARPQVRPQAQRPVVARPVGAQRVA